MIDRAERARLASSITGSMISILDSLANADDPNEPDWDGLVSHCVIMYHDLGLHLDELRKEHDPPIIERWKCVACLTLNPYRRKVCTECNYKKGYVKSPKKVRLCKKPNKPASTRKGFGKK